MALQATGLRDVLIAATEGHTVYSTVLPSMATAIATYIMSNAVVNFAWVGIDPLIPEDDPVVTATGEILDLDFNFTPSLASRQSNFFTHFKSELVAGLTASNYNITTSGFSTGPQSMSTSPMISSLTLSVSGPGRNDALLQLSTCIVNWVKAQMPTAPVIGSHAAYKAPPGTGGTVTSII